METRRGRLQGLLVAVMLGVWLPALLGASCDKKSAARPSPTANPSPSPAEPSAGGAGVESTLPGVDLTELSEAQRKRFFESVDKLESPCAKPHSLLTSLKTDPACRRSVFAARYVVRLAQEDLVVGEISERYEARYVNPKVVKFDLKTAPYEGIPTAGVVVVEFFDYGCPHCKAMMPLFADLLAEFPSDLVVYFKHFPLAGHADSVPAAMAAVAAQRQGKFRQMHQKLFANQADQSLPILYRCAKEVGLDMGRFDVEMKDPVVRAQVEADRTEALAVPLPGTPAVFINGRLVDELNFDVLRDWVAEEIAVGRGH